jgi:transposase-like protein DUF772
MGKQVVPVKAFGEWTLGVAQEQREFIVERTDAELEIAETDAIGWLWRLGYLQSDGSRYWFVIERNRSACNRLKPELVAATDERADMLGSFGGQNDRRGGIATERGGAFVDAESADQQERASRRAIAPEKLLRSLLLQALYSVRSEQLLMEQLDYNLLFRWFVGLNMDDVIWDVTVFTKNRDRLLDGTLPKPSSKLFSIRHASGVGSRTSTSP